LIITSDIEPETALTALARFILPASAASYVNVPVRELEKPHSIKTLLENDGNDATHVICFGDFWKLGQIEEVETKVSKIYNIRFLMTDNTTSPTTPTFLLLEILFSLYPVTPMAKYALTKHCALIDMINNRMCGKKTHYTQPLFTGLFNTFTDIPFEEKIYKLFTDELIFEDIIKLGTSIVASQVQIARDRAIKNSRRGKFTSGKTYAVTEGPEFTNLTHEELHSLYNDVDVTVVTRLIFDKDNVDHVAHSLKSWNDDVDVRALVGTHGGGTSDCAGARKHINIQLDY